eukprot:4956074-Prymnesium_polylepis.2
MPQNALRRANALSIRQQCSEHDGGSVPQNALRRVRVRQRPVEVWRAHDTARERRRWRWKRSSRRRRDGRDEERKLPLPLWQHDGRRRCEQCAQVVLELLRSPEEECG